MAEAIVTSWIGVTAISCPIGNGADGRRLPARWRFHQAARLTWQLDAGAHTESVTVNVLIETLRAHALGEFDGRDVAGLPQRLIGAEQILMMTLVDHRIAVIVDQTAGYIDHSPSVGIIESGVMTFSSSAAEYVTSLKVEPGS